jgi:hypothetical protein
VSFLKFIILAWLEAATIFQPIQALGCHFIPGFGAVARLNPSCCNKFIMFTPFYGEKSP